MGKTGGQSSCLEEGQPWELGAAGQGGPGIREQLSVPQLNHTRGVGVGVLLFPSLSLFLQGTGFVCGLDIWQGPGPGGKGVLFDLPLPPLPPPGGLPEAGMPSEGVWVCFLGTGAAGGRQQEEAARRAGWDLRWASLHSSAGGRLLLGTLERHGSSQVATRAGSQLRTHGPPCGWSSGEPSLLTGSPSVLQGRGSASALGLTSWALARLSGPGRVFLVKQGRSGGPLHLCPAGPARGHQ